MNQLFTKSSVDAKLEDTDLQLFAKVCEKGLNDHTRKNQEYTNDFKLTAEQEDFYRLKKFRVIKKMEHNMFCKQAISDRFAINVETKKNKSFIRCYQNNELVLEIAATPTQIEAIENKFYYDFDYYKGTNATKKYQLFYAGTFMYKNKETTVLSSKLSDLRLFKIVKL